MSQQLSGTVFSSGLSHGNDVNFPIMINPFKDIVLLCGRRYGDSFSYLDCTCYRVLFFMSNNIQIVP